MKQVRRLTDSALEDIAVMRDLCSVAGEPWAKTDPRLVHTRANIVIWRGVDDAGVGVVEGRVIHTPFEPGTILDGGEWPSDWEWGWAVSI